MEQNAKGKLWMSRVTLRPQIVFNGERQPTTTELNEMHHKAHADCFIANSVKSDIVVEEV